MPERPLKNLIALHDKSPGEIRDTKDLHKHNKGSSKQTQHQHQIKKREVQTIPIKIETR